MKLLEKSALFLMSGIMPVFIAACYGAPIEGDTVNAWGAVKDKASGNPIGNILVRCLFGQSIEAETYTAMGDGSYEFSFESWDGCDELEFEDVDGEDNGGKFATKTIPFAEEAEVALELEE